MKKNIRIIILIFLVVIMVFVWASNFKTMRRRKIYRRDSSVSKHISEEKKDFIFWGDKTIKKRQESEFKQWGRNPFTLGGRLDALLRFNLMGILWDRDSPQAIINEKIVEVGDVIDGNKVIKILRDHVILYDGQNTFQLRLWQGEEE